MISTTCLSIYLAFHSAVLQPDIYSCFDDFALFRTRCFSFAAFMMSFYSDISQPAFHALLAYMMAPYLPFALSSFRFDRLLYLYRRISFEMFSKRKSSRLHALHYLSLLLHFLIDRWPFRFWPEIAFTIVIISATMLSHSLL